jgi:hypothetical protein
MNWPKRVANNILPLSNEQSNIAKAFTEWSYNGKTRDLGEPIADCQLCDHPNIRYQFTIENSDTENKLEVGSACITKFDIRAVNSLGGGRLSSEATKRIVSRDLSKMVNDAKKSGVIWALSELALAVTTRELDSFNEQLQKRGAFTPLQLVFLIELLITHKIPYQPSDFKMIIRRNVEKMELKQMNHRTVMPVWDCMSSTQRRFWHRNHKV